jgi:glycosyltransferase involved in cell wall biosynthesis
MRLCWLIPDDRGGGTAAVALSCCRQAAQAGHEVTLLMALRPTGHLDEHIEEFAVDTLGIEPRSPDAPERLVRWLQTNPQNILFLNSCEEITPALPHIPRGIRCVDVVHDTAAQYWRRAVGEETALDAIIAVSRSVAAEFRGRLDDPTKLRVAHNGTVFPDPPETASTANDMVFVGGSKPIKGAGDVVDLWPYLLDHGFDGQLHWFGGLSHSLRERVAALPQSDRIVDRGRVPRSEIFQQAARSKALLMLSRVEPFGMVTIEGMGMGAIPAAWDISTGTKEIVTHGKTGFFAPLGDFEALAARVVDALQHHEDMRDDVIRVARERFSETAMWARYASLIDDLKHRPPASRPGAGATPPAYEPPRRYFQMIPEPIRRQIRTVVEQSPKLGYWLRDWRGF